MLGSKPPVMDGQTAGALAASDFRRLLESEVDYVHRSLRRLGVKTAELDDLTQQVFLVVMSRWSDFDQARPLRPWLFGIAYRTASTRSRKNNREAASDRLDEHLHPQAALDVQHESRELVLAALERMPLPHRAVLSLHAIDGVAMKDVAKELNIPLFTAYSRFKRAREEFEAAVRGLLGRRQFSDLVSQGVPK